MFFSDIHTHLLYATDDGTATRDEMFRAIDMAYDHGTRFLCVTPHFCPEFFGDNRARAQKALEILLSYRDEKYKDLEILFGNELYYTHDGISWMKNGLSRPIGETRYVLVEFDVNSSEDHIAEGVDRLLNIGYIPIIAHAERYKRLSAGRLSALRENGALVQINAEALNCGIRFFARNLRAKTLLSEKMADFVASDAHGINTRPPLIKKAFDYISQAYGREYAEELCLTNAKKLLFAKNDTEETDE